MLQQPSLDVPKAGRSRFSKALPAVPGLDIAASSSPVYSSSRPTYNAPPTLPQLPSFVDEDVSSPLNSPLPSLPLSQPQQRPQLSPIGGPPTMSIPRRPVAKPLAPPPPPAEPVSPAYSLSSLLSAYSHSSGESLVQDVTKDDAAEKTTSPTYTVTTSQQPVASPNPTIMSSVPRRKPVGDPKPPPTPAKETPSERSVTPPNARPSNSGIGMPSSPSPQIWRRRSLKGSRDLADLKIDQSHGSTAATQPTTGQMKPHPRLPSDSQKPQPTLPSDAQKPQPPAPQDSAKALPQPPRAIGLGGLAGRNIRPGGALSRTKSTDSNEEEAKSKTLPAPPPQEQPDPSASEHSARPNMNRPPTPEYRNGDVKAPVIERILSPVSPASSPEPPKELTPKPTVAQTTRDSPTNEVRPPPRKLEPSPTQDLRPSKSTPDLQSRDPTPVNEPLPARPPLGYGMAPFERPASRGAESRYSGESAKMGGRSSSARPDQRRPMEQIRNVPPESDPRLVYSEGKGYLYKGRDGTLYPEMKTPTQEPDARAFYFPKQTTTPMPEGTVIKAHALRESHFSCYQKHKFMNRRANWNHPLTCQTCDKANAEDRWVCSFCHVRMCESCLSTFNNNQRDLRRLQEALGRSATTTQPSTDTAALALGLEINF
ncbi:hypothetical protein B0I35DRAFT_473783 [Stachybotrys elegans]|uniref:Uncharacterized protein n=1 Tax=Stachybotrys elegans TaxID=80388 RepID=A0A8K0T8J4_9HYPO|nr:hypothetical protein B0I35DRAFT_473783 [Stachybotrys elegans]